MIPVENQCRQFYIVSTVLCSDHTYCMMPWQIKSFTRNIGFHQNILNYCFSCSSASPVKMLCRHLKTKCCFFSVRLKVGPVHLLFPAEQRGADGRKLGAGSCSETTASTRARCHSFLCLGELAGPNHT